MDLLSIIFIGIFVVEVLVLLTPVFLIIYGIVKKKYKLVKITSIITAIILLLVFLYHLIFPTHFPYIDLWIYGKTKKEIIKIYGIPEYNLSTRIGYYIGEDNGVLGTGVMDSNDQYFYYIYFDADGKANKIDIGIQLGG